MESVRSFIQKTTQLNPHRRPGPQLAELVHSLFSVEAIAIYDSDLDEVDTSGKWFDNLSDTLQNIFLFETSSEEVETGLIRRVLRMGMMPIGALQIRGELTAQASDIIAAIISVTFDRYRGFANESRIESARQVEVLRTTVLDSLAHAYKSPLTAIEAASSGLFALGELTEAQNALVLLIDEQAQQLARLTNQLLVTSRLEANDLSPRFELVQIAPVLDDVVSSLRDTLSGFSVETSVSPDNLTLRCDRGLVTALLSQYLDNAGKYASAGTRIVIRAEELAEMVRFSAHNIGPIIPAHDCEHIFDRYYRSATTAGKTHGTGIGLSIAKRVAQAHGGNVWVTSDASKGTIFYAELPHYSQETPYYG